MEQTGAAEQKLNISGKNAIVKNYDSWSIKLYRKQRRIIIETHDYHAEPLTLTRDEFCDLARLMGLHVRRRNNKKQQSISKK